MIAEVLKTFFIAMTPIGELRVALPLAIVSYKISWPIAYIVSVLGNIIPVILIVYLLGPATNFLEKHSKFFHNFLQKLFHYTRKRHSKKFEILEELALISFVAIPLPITGGWSGAIAAFVFGIPPKKSIPLIFAGILIAGVIVTIITNGVALIL